MHLQIHHHDGSLNQLLLNIPKGIKIVIDHFGRPASDNEFIKNPTGIDKHAGLLWVKISGQYRIPNIDHQSIFHYWLEKIGSQRLLWGSDWPHTQHEDTQNFASQVKNLRSLTNDAYLTEKILSQNPLDLYWAD
jgi:predicted TIM-barrel fold metal-dependent hydrolase